MGGFVFSGLNNLLDINIKRNFVYAGLIGLVIGAYLYIVFSLQTIFKYSPDLYIIIDTIALVIAALGFYPLEQKLRVITDNYFYKNRSGNHQTLSRLLQNMVTCLELNSLTDLVVNTIYNEMKVKSLSFYLITPDKKYYKLLKQKNSRQPAAISSSDTFIKYIEKSSTVLLKDQLPIEDIPILDYFTQHQTESVVPFRENNELQGFLLLDHKLSGDPFLPEDLRLLELIGHQIVVGLQNARLYESSQNKVKELTTMVEISRLISSTLDSNQILKNIIKIVVEVSDVDRGILFLYDETKQSLFSVSGHGASEKDVLGITLEVGNSVLGRVFKAGKPVYIPHTTRNTEYVQRLGVDSYIVVPMKAKDKVIGLLAMDNASSKRTLENINMEFLVGLAGQMAITIENARLYEEARHKVKELSLLNENISTLQSYNENILKSMPSGVLSLDLENKIVTLNSTAENILGVAFGKAKHKPAAEVWADFPELSNALTQEGANQELEYKLHGKIKNLSISTKILHDPQGQKTGLLSVVTDMSEFKNLEKQVRRSDRVTALGTMVAGIAHEIKNPLTSMKLFTQLMEENKNNPEFWAEYGSIISGEVTRLENIVENFLGFARTKEADMQAVSLKEVLENVYKLTKTQSSKENVEIKLAVTEDVKIKADTQKLMQVFLNLVLNAVQSMPKDRTEKGQIALVSEIDRVHDQVRISIIDNGCGIPKENLEKLFTPFFTTKQKGTGLGLSIVHKIIEEHDGKIQVESEIGKGTIFYITLPLVKAEVLA